MSAGAGIFALQFWRDYRPGKFIWDVRRLTQTWESCLAKIQRLIGQKLRHYQKGVFTQIQICLNFMVQVDDN